MNSEVRVFTGGEPPRPGGRLGKSIVIATRWMRDEPLAMLLLLEPEPPYYSLIDVEWDGDSKWCEVVHGPMTFMNIVPAVEAFMQNGGGGLWDEGL